MGRRTSAARSVPGSAMGGVLRAVQRSARTATRRPVAATPDDGLVATPAATRTVACATPLAAMVTTGPDGVAHWTFPEAMPATPAVTATVLSHTPATVTVKWVTLTGVALHVWDEYGAPARAGVDVHVLAFPTAR